MVLQLIWPLPLLLSYYNGSIILAAIKGWPILGTMPMLLKDMGKTEVFEKRLYNKLHNELGPVFKLKMLGKSLAFIPMSHN